ncbi:MAG: hypothetical protein L0Z62_47890 [Gemmataceae bacterium]|nr:hypothetical protein [Gemmataceae bacterium]
MSDPPRPSLAELLADDALITAAVQRAVREAVLMHARAGNPVAAWEDGKVVWLQPAEVLRRLAAADTNEDSADKPK